jgi:hypothetical protein
MDYARVACLVTMNIPALPPTYDPSDSLPNRRDLSRTILPSQQTSSVPKLGVVRQLGYTTCPFVKLPVNHLGLLVMIVVLSTTSL